MAEVLVLSGRGSEGNHLFRLGRRRVRLGPILFTTHKIERRRKGTALNSEIKRRLPLKLPLKARNESSTTLLRFLASGVV